MKISVREATSGDRTAITKVVIAAFGEGQGSEIDTLVGDLLSDETAIPRFSLVAETAGEVVGHVLFTSIRIEGSRAKISALILAPLAVLPKVQGKGIGGRLIADGLKRSREAGHDLVFVLGHPDYYTRHGFEPAGPHHLSAPYPIPAEHADGWMVQELRPGMLGTVEGTVRCAKTLDDPRHWIE